ncbi:mandelate racemase/muconate lactonizing enzyme family protein [Microbacterium immunditiarum]|uniref:L-alanine-DL-glutamate epimerase-like enolase superfamily enzyme n=1 Tax=Microbacterium immunditiarum TaxID=337480 RepID=A0A7Y9KJS2_9MICO|nr:mandelate racemase/muconate lactonizing enzyme family protein [Microbacterium immunditiarum]NYE18069.1 L-alanine-DL-glutamate epimerase-like enolase superfamily enzyme [Microbacterium immunditiarum]
MKIVDVQAHGLRGATPKGGWANELDPNDVVHTVIMITAESGEIGYGSSFTSEHLVRAALEVLRPMLLGEDAREADRISQVLHENTFWQGRGGAITHAISGIDIALWDLLGRALGEPVWRLLGGAYRTRVRPYASVLMQEPPLLAEELSQLRARGFTAFKIGWGDFGRVSTARDEEYISVARGIVGVDCILAVDAGGSDAFWRGNRTWARRTADMLFEYGVDWFEEPLHPDDIDGFVELRRTSRVPISGGETFSRRQEFAKALSAGAFDIVQPDLTKAGGFSEARRIAVLAESVGARLIPHGWNTAFGLAADIHFVAASPLSDLVEYKTGSPYIDDLLEGSPFELDNDGLLAVPSSSGLGVDASHSALRTYSSSFAGHR